MVCPVRPVLFASLLEQTFRESSTLKQMYMDILAGEAEYEALLSALILRLLRLEATVLRQAILA